MAATPDYNDDGEYIGPLPHFRHPVLGDIIGFATIDEFDAAVAAHNLSQGLDADGMPPKED